MPAVSRLQSTLNNDVGPKIADDYLYAVIDVVDQIAKETGKTVPQIALNWLLQRPTVSTLVIGARNEEQLRDNLGAIGWNLTADQIKRLDSVSATPARLESMKGLSEIAEKLIQNGGAAKDSNVTNV